MKKDYKHEHARNNEADAGEMSIRPTFFSREKKPMLAAKTMRTQAQMAQV